MKIAFLAVLILVTLFVALMMFRVKRSEEMKIVRFAPLPNSPNCVSTESQSSDPRTLVPIAYKKPTEEVKSILKSEITQLPRTKLSEDDGQYLRFEFKSNLFGFIDDVEFRIDDTAKKILFRSGSRVGHSDFGVNKKRMEMIRALLAEKI